MRRPVSPTGYTHTKRQIKAQQSGFDLERKKDTIGQSEAACGG